MNMSLTGHIHAHNITLRPVRDKILVENVMTTPCCRPCGTECEDSVPKGTLGLQAQQKNNNFSALVEKECIFAL
jgi:hypothetical protein